MVGSAVVTIVISRAARNRAAQSGTIMRASCNAEGSWAGVVSGLGAAATGSAGGSGSRPFSTSPMSLFVLASRCFSELSFSGNASWLVLWPDAVFVAEVCDSMSPTSCMGWSFDMAISKAVCLIQGPSAREIGNCLSRVFENRKVVFDLLKFTVQDSSSP